MNFLQGKSPAERNKFIAVIVLGALALVALSYTFLFNSAPKKVANSNKNANNNSRVNGQTETASTKTQIPSPDDLRDELPMSLPNDPFPPVSGVESSRNIFALYNPDDRPATVTPVINEKPTPIPSPPPPPPVTLTSVNPQMVYAQSKDFTMEVIGDKFTPETKVLFNGQEIATQFVNPQRMTAQISASLISGEGQRQIMVRSQDGKLFSNVAVMMVQAPPTPNFNFVGLVARRGYNNDTATLQDKVSKQYQNVRLGENIGRFKVASISSKEVVMQDSELGFRHSLTFVDEKSAGRPGASAQTNNGFQNLNPNMPYQYQPNPAMPNPYMQQPQPAQPQPPQPTNTRNQDEEDGDDDNR